jgi:hypothetical protein
VSELPRTLATHLLALGESAALIGESMFGSGRTSSADRRARAAAPRCVEQGLQTGRRLSFEQALAYALSID